MRETGRHCLKLGAAETVVGQEAFRSINQGASRDRQGGGREAPATVSRAGAEIGGGHDIGQGEF